MYGPIVCQLYGISSNWLQTIIFGVWNETNQRNSTSTAEIKAGIIGWPAELESCTSTSIGTAEILSSFRFCHRISDFVVASHFVSTVFIVASHRIRRISSSHAILFFFLFDFRARECFFYSNASAKFNENRCLILRGIIKILFCFKLKKKKKNIVCVHLF